MGEDRELDMAEFEQIERFAFDAWGLDPATLDPVEAYHALRILRIQNNRQIPGFDDFLVAWKKRG